MGFNVGQTYMSSGIGERIITDAEFSKGVIEAVKKYVRCDWGDTSEHDKLLNDEAVETKGRILAGYKIGDEKIWIITDYGHVSTAILFPSEY